MVKRTFIDRIFVAAQTVLALSVLFFASCVKEQDEGCPPDVRLYIKTDEEMAIFGSRGDSRAHDIKEWYSSIDTVAVYVFDENEKYVTVWHGGPYKSGVDYEVPLRTIGLPEGVYTFVAWTNRGDEYMCNLEELESLGEDFYLDDMRMNMAVPDDGDAIGNLLRHRHHGILERAYVSHNSILFPGPNAITLKPSLHKVNFTVTGIAPSTLGDGHTISVVDNNPTHSFRNEYIPGLDKYRHRHALTTDTSNPGTRAGDDALSASMYLMQLDDNTMTSVEIHNVNDPDEPVHVLDDLTGLIRTVYSEVGGRNVDFDERLEFDITIRVNTEFTVSVRINGWDYIRKDIGDL